METQSELDYKRIADAINFLKLNYKTQPALEDVAEHVHLSPFHFQRMFKDWAGVTPKQFLQFLSVEHAKGILNSGSSIFEVAYETGLSGTGRLHDLFIKVEGMTPGEYKNGGSGLHVNYSFMQSPFGQVLVASTVKGVCYMAFADEGNELAMIELRSKFSNAQFVNQPDNFQRAAMGIFNADWTNLQQIKLHLKGTDFQLKVWETLLKVPMGGLTSYSSLAQGVNSPNAQRAVGTAVAQNPVAFLIPCHRVIKSTGETGQYHWGSNRKDAIIAWEAAKTISAA